MFFLCFDKEFDIYLVGLGQAMVFGTQNSQKCPNISTLVLQRCSKLKNPETLERKIARLDI
jgi:hypothetical protein